MSAADGPARVPAGAAPFAAADRPDQDVPSPTPRSRIAGVDRLDVAIAAAVVLFLVSLAAGLASSVEVRIVAPGLDLAFDTVTTLVTVAVAALAWQRYRDRGQRTALFETSAFLVLTASNSLLAIEALLGVGRVPGAASAPLGQGSLYFTTAARLGAALLLVVGEAPALRRSGTRWPHLVAFGPAAAIVAIAALAPAWLDKLPPLVAPASESAGTSVLPATTAANVVLQVSGAILFVVAAALARRRALRGGPVSERYLAVGLVVAAIAQFHLALYPSAFAGTMTSGDLLFLVFDVILLLGIEAETRAYVVDLRRANLGLERLRDADVRRAAVEERARLSRELHDGLAQDLWFAKLKVGRLAALPDLGPEARGLCEELDEAIDAGLTEARQAVMALRVASDGATFAELMSGYVDDYGDRFGIRAEFTCADDLPPLGTRVEAELLRITQEALTNVLRHADATVVHVDVIAVPSGIRLTVRDNGRGFDPAAVAGSGFGLTSMSERAALIGGRFRVESRPHDGTRVTVEVRPDAKMPPAAGTWTAEIGEAISAGAPNGRARR